MCTMPRVSVVIATYNWSSVLPYAVGSVLRQTYDDFEVLVVGDGCTDDSEAVVKAVGDPRVRWTNLPVNSGHQSTPNNEGLRLASGEVIAYLGHDDLWLPHHLEASLRALDTGAADVCYSLVMCIGPEGRFVWPSVPQPSRGLYSPPSGMMHRRRVTDGMGGWRPYRELRLTPDVELWQRAAAAGYVFAAVPRLTALKFPASWRRNVYRIRPSHEQAEWLSRMAADANFEQHVLVDALLSERPGAVSYRRLVGQLGRETLARLRRPSVLPWRRRGHNIDAVRTFKGL
jgi:glycosyltransferase involved in cell wall biosynthesis